ncbi:Conserved hypothetical protein [Shewanella piezotolerans WP3]|uniref:Uncharacterized protein n=1 Tax=Shewanella piezotolerans (strain WP3 / JCM 13877) TaxID=225849 RepID=B8CQR3_SHEPW|nr:hypothetical protein [Shewanella piezotolerans]ACJ30529.1 Conserved hypothetical protein [Shewanella piezotolerans WP3]
MSEFILISKILVSILAVLGLSFIAERVSPKVAGILSGYPLGTAIALFYIGLENGEQFAANSAVFTLSGFSASLVLVYVYYRVSFALDNQVSSISVPMNVAIASLCSIIAFLSVGFLLTQFELALLPSLLLSITAIILFGYRLKTIRDAKVQAKSKLIGRVLLLRALAAAAIVVGITGAAKLIGPNWSGVFSAFPITLFPFLLIIHLTYGSKQVHTIIKHYPYGLGALLVYAVCIVNLYPTVGLRLGTLLAFVAASIYLLLLALLQKRLSRQNLARNLS